MSGNCRPKDKPSKAILRVAPYSLAPYKIDRYSVGPGEPQQICAVGFDPFTSETQLRTIFGQFGSVAQLQNKINPNTGSFLGIALIKYRDSVRDGQEVLATVAAKRAEQEMHGQRINLHTVRVECDREGKRCQRHVENVLERARRELQKERSMHTQAAPPPPVEQAAIPAKIDSPAPPLNAPKGPSGAPKGPSGRTSIPAGPAASFKPPEGPKAAAVPNPRSIAASLVEEEPILGKIKRKPYIHIPHSSVPVLGTTIPHLKKRLKAYDWREIRLDKSGYYVVFEDSKRGEDETERTFNECNRAALFTYNMEMECQKYGNPNYERSPSPERVIAEKKTRESYERLKREEEEDMEIEKQRRAENLDPVLGALEQLRTELRDRIMSDIKTRIAIPIFHDSLDPAQHVAKRRKLGLPDISDHENKAPSVLLTKAGDASHNPRSRFGQGSKPLRPHDPNQQRRGGRFGDRERDRDRAGGNAFMDERRRKPPPRPVHARGLHYRLQQMYDQDEDSDDERRTSPTRDTEEQESRPLSRNSTPFDSESLAGDTPKHTRRKVSEWEEEDKETFDALQKQLIGHLLHKEPEDLATRELELVIGTLPRTSRYCARAKTELFIRQKAKEDDALFSVKSEVKKDLHEDVVMGGQERDSTPALEDTKAVKEPAKKKRKSKKQIFEEREALKAEVEEAAAAAAEKPVEPSTLEKVNQKKVELEVADNNEYREVDLRVSLGKPKRTVADNASVVLDIDGWQHTIKDDEDLHFARKALEQERMAAIGDVKLWAWKQKQIKTLNNGGAMGISHGHQTGITGYYVPNPTGSARTEGVKKILNEEKSKYLPHRIKVQRAREERQAEAKANPTAAAEAAKTVAAEKLISTATSRSNRVNNRRLVNDINLQREALAASSGGASTDADTAIRFNQLKKRKKLVKFDRSAIHGWGLYAEENIAVNDLIIEYVGEKVRQKVADLREIKYEKQGVGSSYLFRMMDDEIVDATKKGGIARFINHSCSPNCTAKIIKVEGTPRIVIYALKDIGKSECSPVNRTVLVCEEYLLTFLCFCR